MAKCNHCNINLQYTNNTCPLCNREIIDIKDNNQNERLYPRYNRINEDRLKVNIVKRMYVFLSISVVLICMLINILVWQGVAWSLCVASLIGYGWILIDHTVISKKSIGSKVLVQFFGLALMFLIVDSLDGKVYWAMNYALEFLCVIALIVASIFSFKRNDEAIDYLHSQIALMAISIIPVILFFVGVINVGWSVVAVVFTIIVSILAMLLFHSKQYKEEMKMRLYF